MKTKIALLIVLFLMSININAQIDRSIQPQPGPAPKISLNKPIEFKLKNGLTVLVVENHKLPRVSYSLVIDNKPVKFDNKAGVESITGAMLGNGTTNIPKDIFNDEIDFLGASLNFSYKGGYASSLSKYANRILELMADASINPLLIEDEFNKEKDKLIEALKSEAKSVDAVAGRVGRALSYGVNHPYGEFTSEETVNNVTYQDVVACYQKYFKPNNAYLVVVGDVEPKAIQKQIKKHFGKWKPSSDLTITVPDESPNPEFTQINFIDMPNAVQSNITITNNVNLNMNDSDYHSVLIANKILGGGFNSYLNMNLREEHGYTYGARSNVGTDKYASRFTAGAAVRNAVTDSAVVETLKEIKRIKVEPIDNEALKNAKAKYVGDFVLALEQPQTIARYALNIKLNNLPEDFYTTYLEKINAVTTNDVTRVANKYFSTENARIIVVGKGSDVIENLEKINIPIKYFDTYANPVGKPVFSKPIPDGVTAQTVIDNYLSAIGGKEKAMTVKSTLTKATITGLAPFPLNAELKGMTPNKSSLEMSAEGMGIIMKQKWNGETGYTEQQGQKTVMTADEIAVRKEEKTIFPELYFDASNLSLESLTTIDAEDVYKIKVNKGKKDSYRFYSTKTGLLIRIESTTKIEGQEVTNVVDFGNYTDVDGIQFPYSMKVTNGPQAIPFDITSVEVNNGVTDADFE